MGNNVDPCNQKCVQKCQLPFEPKQLLATVQSNNAIPKQGAYVDTIQPQIINQNETGAMRYHDLFKRIIKENTSISTFKRSSLVLDENMVMLGNTPIIANLVSELMDVPYDIVRLSITQKLNRVIKNHATELMGKYQRQQNKLQKWKLHKKGHYINYLGHNLYGLFTHNSYFVGQLAEIGDQLLPVGEGILVSQEGIYTGQFEKGKARGKGTFKGIDPPAIYSGIWDQGKLVQGTVEDDQFKFEGIMKDSLATGEGTLFFKESKTKYLGQFENGYIHDKKGYLENDKYVYQGGFQNGYKYGQGRLTEKERDVDNKAKVYIPTEIFEGEWNRDRFEGRPRYVTLKKGVNTA